MEISQLRLMRARSEYFTEMMSKPPFGYGEAFLFNLSPSVPPPPFPPPLSPPVHPHSNTRCLTLARGATRLYCCWTARTTRSRHCSPR